MPEAPTSAATPTKWWATSLTIWGALVTAVATVLPTLEPLLGSGLTVELVRQLGADVVLVLQALAGLAGTILTIYGRVRATSGLARRQVTVKLPL
ncbi:MAG TPA: hypothetical protein VFZ16_01495 [Hyphomicrobiaceae bacterium]|nr:hypothetical protein [Hyphomicrobiaceae bacterium]